MPQIQINATTDLNLWQQMQTSTDDAVKNMSVQGYRSTALITRGDNTDRYEYGDVWGNAFELTNFAAGEHIFLNEVQVFFDTSIPLIGFFLYLYSQRPSTIEDNEPFNLTADKEICLTLGGINLGLANPVPGSIGKILSAEKLGKQIQPTETSMWGRLVVLDYLLPNLPSETATIVVMCSQYPSSGSDSVITSVGGGGV